MPTQTFGMAFNGDGSQPVSVSPPKTGSYSVILDLLALGIVTDVEHDVNLPITGLKGIIVYAIGQDVTLHTNHAVGASPDQTLVIKKDTFGIVWSEDSPIPNPITAIIAKIFVTTTVAGGELHLRALYA